MCVVVTMALAISLYSDEPKSIVFEDCGKPDLRVSYVEGELKELEVISYDETLGMYIIKDKKFKLETKDQVWK